MFFKAETGDGATSYHFGTKINCNNGIVSLTKDGNTTYYTGKTVSAINGKISIDGTPVTLDDPRIVSSEKTSSVENNSQITIDSGCSMQ